jgi:hypothetical protein
MKQGVPPVGRDLSVWANDLRRWLARSLDNLTFKTAGAGAPADEDGVMLWDAANGYPVVSKNGVWRQVLLADGHAVLSQDANITAAAADTAYKIALDDLISEDITLTGSPLTDITFVEGGLYTLSFSAQISSTSSSTVEFRFWPRLNGVDATGSTIVASLHNNGATIVVSRTTIFNVADGDVLNVMWATDSTAGFLEAHAATAYAPASPSVTLSISRVAA